MNKLKNIKKFFKTIVQLGFIVGLFTHPVITILSLIALGTAIGGIIIVVKVIQDVVYLYIKQPREHKKKLEEMQKSYVEPYTYIENRVDHIQKVKDVDGSTVLAEECIAFDSQMVDIVQRWNKFQASFENKSASKMDEMQNIESLQQILLSCQENIPLAQSKEDLEFIKIIITNSAFELQMALDASLPSLKKIKSDDEFFQLKEQMPEIKNRIDEINKRARTRKKD